MAPDDATLEPPIRRRAVPMEAKALRDLAVNEFEELEEKYGPRIDAHLDAYEAAINDIVDLHANIANRTDLVIGADTRWSAIWELSGRVLAQCRVLAHDLRGGYGLEAVGTLRSAFEAMHLLIAISFEDAVLRRWLSGDDVRPRKARAVLARKQALAWKRMKAAGVEPGGDVVSSGEWLYGYFSKAAHHRRGPNTTSISLGRREYAYGPHPDASVRAREVAHAGETIETALIAVTDSLASIVGRHDLAQVISNQAARLKRVRNENPLTD